MAATSMAAALAASLPAPQAAPTPSAPTYEAIPASMAQVIDIEAEIPITSVQLDAIAVSKIIKHAKEAPGSSAHGLLLGLDLDGTLEVSNSFPLPHHSSDEDDKSAKGLARYQGAMLRSLKEVQADDSVIGFYQGMTLGSFFNQTLVDTQAIHQERLRHGGIIIVHDVWDPRTCFHGVAKTHQLPPVDVSQTARGNASFRAFRLTRAFLDAYKRNNFSATSLIDHRLTYSSILEEVPLKIRTNALVSSFLGTLAEAPAVPAAQTNPALASSSAAIPPSYSALNLGAANMPRNLELIVEALDNYKTEEGNLAYLHRQIAREKAKADAYVAKRKEENAARVAAGLAPAPEEDVSRLFKIPAEPNRLESMLLLGRIDAYGKSLEETASTGLVKMYAAKGNAGN